jgi:hypothetical protein
MKLQLPTVTLIIIDCLNAQRAINVLEHCKSLCDFGAVKLLTSIPIQYEHRIKIMPLNTLIAYSVFMLTKVNQYIDTEHLLVVQRDGWILNPQSFDNSWLELDYIAPLFVQYNHVGSGGFSLRSKKLMDNVAATMPAWDGTQREADKIQQSLQYYEDGVISLSGKFSGFKFATNEQASHFAQGGNKDKKYHIEFPFGFHGVLQDINHLTGSVSPVCEHHNNPHCNCTINHVNFLTQNEWVK